MTPTRPRASAAVLGLAVLYAGLFAGAAFGQEAPAGAPGAEPYRGHALVAVDRVSPRQALA